MTFERETSGPLLTVPDAPAASYLLGKPTGAVCSATAMISVLQSMPDISPPCPRFKVGHV